MYDSNIAAWVVSTLTAVIAVGMIAPELSTRRISTIHRKDIHHG